MLDAKQMKQIAKDLDGMLGHMELLFELKMKQITKDLDGMLGHMELLFGLKEQIAQLEWGITRPRFSSHRRQREYEYYTLDARDEGFDLHGEFSGYDYTEYAEHFISFEDFFDPTYVETLNTSIVELTEQEKTLSKDKAASAASAKLDDDRAEFERLSKLFNK